MELLNLTKISKHFLLPNGNENFAEIDRGKLFSKLGALVGFEPIHLDREDISICPVWQVSLLLQTALQMWEVQLVWLDDVPAPLWPLWSEKLQRQCQIESTCHCYRQKSIACSLLSAPATSLIFHFSRWSFGAGTKPRTMQFRSQAGPFRGCNS